MHDARTLSLICSLLPRKSLRDSVARPVASRTVRSKIAFGSSTAGALRQGRCPPPRGIVRTAELLFLPHLQRSQPFRPRFAGTALCLGPKPRPTHLFDDTHGVPSQLSRRSRYSRDVPQHPIVEKGDVQAQRFQQRLLSVT